MFSIVASDLDGTLLSPNHRITSYTKKTLRLLTMKGIHFIFATGRHHIDVEKIKRKININSYMITSNGAKIHDNYGNLIYSHDINEEISFYLLKIVYKNKSIFTNIFRKNEWFVNRHYNNQENFFCESSFNYKIFSYKNFPINGIYKIYYTSSNYNNLIKLENILNKKFGKKINVSFSSSTCLEVMAGGVSKGNSLKYVSNILGFTLKDCISFGDGMNDKEMLKMSGKGCIMYNAEKKLKNILPKLEVIGSNKDDAVSLYLNKMFFK
ncbi:sugar/pyridoxal phosphate phosphatase YigL [Sodalis-like secondary symbiont of Drepanosiphum platanoidis]|uniref:sugar/pyridoxal phosphate phosphatase YigL n=1 Tax=Sodalis-like secondary symbiont of Drepanosiphum platanoidis TaxID=2994493 RepID=UPI003463C200